MAVLGAISRQLLFASTSNCTKKHALDTEKNLSISRQSCLPAVYNVSPGEISLQGAVAASNVTQSEHPLDRAKTFSFSQRLGRGKRWIRGHRGHATCSRAKPQLVLGSKGSKSFQAASSQRRGEVC